MKKDDESVSQVEIQGTIDALVSINWLEERDFGIKSYFIPSNLTPIWLHKCRL